MFHFQNSNDRKPFHTSGYAETAYGTSMGATSSQSYRQRAHIDNNRQAVGKYHESSVAHNLKGRSLGSNAGRPVPALRHYTPLAERRRQFGGQSTPQVSPREKFAEPPTRNYNPFA